MSDETMTRDECIQAYERSIDAEYLREALGASLEREKAARDAALEEAARECESVSDTASSHGDSDRAIAWSDAASFIRALKAEPAR